MSNHINHTSLQRAWKAGNSTPRTANNYYDTGRRMHRCARNWLTYLDAEEEREVRKERKEAVRVKAAEVRARLKEQEDNPGLVRKVVQAIKRAVKL